MSKELTGETIVFTKQDARDAINGDLTGYGNIATESRGSSRWYSHHYTIIKRESDGKLFGASFSRGLTECQDHQPFDYEEPVFREVKATEKVITITKYVEV